MVAQITAVVIFLVMFILIITEKFPKHFTTLVCGALTLILVFGVGMNIDNHFLIFLLPYASTHYEHWRKECLDDIKLHLEHI